MLFRSAADAHAAAMTLLAYSVGLLPFVLIRSVTVTFLARGDTITPVKALFASVAVNVALKVLLMDRYAQVGLALATSAGVWINFLLLVWFAARQKLLGADRRLVQSAGKIAVAGVALALALLICRRPVMDGLSWLGALRDIAALAALAGISFVVYGGVVVALFGWRRLTTLQHSAAPSE